jgi:gamma-glutamylcyclotransferase (GGCT)/AIG2-like uncharacterized protein YtfP
MADAPITPIFVYGTLMAAPLLAWVLTGDASKSDESLAQRKPGRITGFTRRSILGLDYPALIRGDASATVDGFVVYPKSRSEWTKLDTFEGDAYTRILVAVDVGGKIELADTYVWAGDLDMLGEDDWSLAVFESEHLEDWLKLFVGIELIG